MCRCDLFDVTYYLLTVPVNAQSHVSRITEKAMTLSAFYHYNAGQYESIPSHLSVSSPSQFSSDRDIVNISDIEDIGFLFLGTQGKSRIFFNFGFITLVKRHGSLVEV